jgi:hypothetical protein
MGNSPACHAARMGFKEIQGLESLRSDAMAGKAGATGPAPEIGTNRLVLGYLLQTKVGVGLGYDIDIPKLM